MQQRQNGKVNVQSTRRRPVLTLNARYNNNGDLLRVAPGGTLADDSDNGLSLDQEGILAAATATPAYLVTFGRVTEAVSAAGFCRVGARTPSESERTKDGEFARPSEEARSLLYDHLKGREKFKRNVFIVVVTMTVFLLALLFCQL